MTRILIVPQTDRNALDLVSYASALSCKFRIIILRNALWGSHIDLARVRESIPFEIVEPDWLLLDGARFKDYQRALYMAKNHGRFIRLLKDIGPDLVITGSDSTAIGKWSVCTARKSRIPSLVVQEGCRYLTDPDKFSMKIKAKVFLSKLAYSILFPPAKFTPEFMSADYVAVWGKNTKEQIVKSGRNFDEVFVIGNVDGKKRDGKKIIVSSKRPFSLLFMDTPYSICPEGTYDLASINMLREQFVSNACHAGCEIVYRPHPFTRAAEMDAIIKIAARFQNVRIVRDRTASELIVESDACATAPSTCMLTVLAVGTPLIQLKFDISGWGKQLWDPVKMYEAGITLTRPDQIGSAIELIRNEEWYTNYYDKSALAAEEVVGPLDGKAAERFSKVVHEILEKHHRPQPQ
jgi:hypothetical protein